MLNHYIQKDFFLKKSDYTTTLKEVTHIAHYEQKTKFCVNEGGICPTAGRECSVVMNTSSRKGKKLTVCVSKLILYSHKQMFLHTYKILNVCQNFT